MKFAITIRTKIWLYQGDSPWHFITIDASKSAAMKQNHLWPARGFGSIPVMATIGNTRWKTSIFPDKDKKYVLPIKKEVRVAESLSAGDIVMVDIRIIN